LACTFDKKNVDAKNPPKFPFQIQVAMKTSLDVFYFNVPCLLHCLLSPKEITKDEFKSYWEKIPAANSHEIKIEHLYQGFTQREDLPQAILEGVQ
jgi:hypothetical protein